jgi:hypothetical protein
MRRFLILYLLLLAVALPSYAPAHALSYQEGVRAAKDQNKPLYLYFYSDS